MHFVKSQEQKNKCQSLLNFLKEEKKKHEQEHTESVSEKKHSVWNVEPIVKAIRSDNLKWFCLLILLGGKLGTHDFEYFVNKIEDESEKFAKKIHLIKFLSKIRDEFDNTLLHHAAWKGKTKCLKILIGCKVIVNERKTDDEQTSCLFMCKNGQTKCANTIFEKNVSVNVYDFNRETPIHLAAYVGHQECVELLIRQGADVNAKDDVDWTPLHCAAAFGKVDCLEMLLANGADVNARTSQQYTPLHLIGFSGTGSKEEKGQCVEMLINAGAEVNAKDEDGNTIFNHSFFQTLREERPDLFKQN